MKRNGASLDVFLSPLLPINGQLLCLPYWKKHECHNIERRNDNFPAMCNSSSVYRKVFKLKLLRRTDECDVFAERKLTSPPRCRQLRILNGPCYYCSLADGCTLSDPHFYRRRLDHRPRPYVGADGDHSSRPRPPSSALRNLPPATSEDKAQTIFARLTSTS